MSYSRWSTSYWYTYWCVRTDPEDRDNALFAICDLEESLFIPAKDLRDKNDARLRWLYTIERIHPDGNIGELDCYMDDFLIDVDKKYPE